MDDSNLERAARLRTIAAEFRTYAAQTDWPAYRARMLDMAVDLDLEAAKLDRYRRFSLAS